MKRVLFVSYSQTGQLASVVRSVAAPLRRQPDSRGGLRDARSGRAVPVSLAVPSSFSTRFPRRFTPCRARCNPLRVGAGNTRSTSSSSAYQVWFLSPSQPMTAFLQSPEAARLLRGRPVITLIACRNMWLMAQENVKQRLSRAGRAPDRQRRCSRIARHSAATFISTPLWMLTGRRGPFSAAWCPRPASTRRTSPHARRFGSRHRRRAAEPSMQRHRALLKGLGAVKRQRAVDRVRSGSAIAAFESGAACS